MALPSLSTQHFLIIVFFVIVQRLLELNLSKNNERKLKQKGAQEMGHEHYKGMVLMHTLWIIGCLILPFFYSVDLAPIWQWFFLFLFLIGQCFRILAITTLKERWTTIVLMLPNSAPVSSGIYRYIQHPNYWGVAIEIFSLPMIWGLWPWAIFFSFLNAVVMYFRLKVEQRALSLMSQSYEKQL